MKAGSVSIKDKKSDGHLSRAIVRSARLNISKNFLSIDLIKLIIIENKLTSIIEFNRRVP